MEEYIKAYEYESNVNPTLNQVPIIKKNVKECVHGINFIDNGSLYNVDCKATSPNLLASFVVLDENNGCDSEGYLIRFKRSSFSEEKEINASSHLFYVLNGKCRFTIEEEVYVKGEEYGEMNVDIKDTEFIVESGEIFICPAFQGLKMCNMLENEKTEVYYVNDSPLLNYLGAYAEKPIFKPCVYDNKFIQENLQKLSNPNNNRKGILLSNVDTEKIGVNTITPILWSLYNELPPITKQRPHRHNSVALDLCISCSDSENIYTLVGDELDENGNIVNPKKVNWKQGEMFITPPGLWHSHHNDGNTYAYILPIQDAGLLLYQRILGISFN
uniref:Cupin 2 conserved barrel domain-containing protein n=1 Tax=viral metagenome TaxID=1070528 RepID=A0A6C0HCD4_9ZZZZ